MVLCPPPRSEMSPGEDMSLKLKTAAIQPRPKRSCCSLESTKFRDPGEIVNFRPGHRACIGSYLWTSSKSIYSTSLALIYENCHWISFSAQFAETPGSGWFPQLSPKARLPVACLVDQVTEELLYTQICSWIKIIMFSHRELISPHEICHFFTAFYQRSHPRTYFSTNCKIIDKRIGNSRAASCEHKWSPRWCDRGPSSRFILMSRPDTRWRFTSNMAVTMLDIALLDYWRYIRE